MPEQAYEQLLETVNPSEINAEQPPTEPVTDTDQPSPETTTQTENKQAFNERLARLQHQTTEIIQDLINKIPDVGPASIVRDTLTSYHQQSLGGMAFTGYNPETGEQFENNGDKWRYFGETQAKFLFYQAKAVFGIFLSMETAGVDLGDAGKVVSFLKKLDAVKGATEVITHIPQGIEGVKHWDQLQQYDEPTRATIDKGLTLIQGLVNLLNQHPEAQQRAAEVLSEQPWFQQLQQAISKSKEAGEADGTAQSVQELFNQAGLGDLLTQNPSEQPAQPVVATAEASAAPQEVAPDYQEFNG